MTTNAQTASRTQSDRRTQTRKALLDATIEVLINRGYDGCSLANVAKYAGLTTGSVQHHFKTKSQMMLAVIEERLFETIEGQAQELTIERGLEDRCKLLIETQWRHYGDPKYLAIWSIILGARSDSEGIGKIIQWQQDAIARHESAIMKLFADYKLKPQQAKAIQYFVNAQLRGLALLQTIDPDPANIRRQLSMLADMMKLQISKP
jgi:AcrR family transcriptional regulator